MKIKIPNTEIQELLSGKGYEYPKYSTQIMNLANQKCSRYSSSYCRADE